MARWKWNVLDQRKKSTKIVLIRRTAPFNDVKALSRSHILIGLSAHTSFPKKQKRIIKFCRGWMHCFRNPDQYIGPDIPRILLHESDFTNEKVFVPENGNKKFDFLYAMKSSANQRRYKNYELFLQCMKVLIGEMGLKGLVVGGKVRIPKEYSSNIKNLGLVHGSKSMRGVFNRCKTVFVPSIADAGPRIITEGLCCNMPIVVNEKIFGGWKYVNKNTGHFFTSASDIGEAYEYVLSKKLNPRDAYLDEFGGYLSSCKNMYNFIKKVAPEAPNAKYYYMKLK